MSAGLPPLVGAKDRLLPGSVPARFFAAGLGFHLLAWLVLAVTPDWLPGFTGGLGPPLATLHLITLGVLTMVAIGAMLQLLPVALRTPSPALAPARLLSWLLIAGVPSLAWGMGSGRVLMMSLGGILVATALAVFAAITAIAMSRARGTTLVIAHVWAALAVLVGLALLGLGLLGDFVHGWLADHAATAMLHLALACYGFLGLLILGLSQILVPMFALSPNPAPLPGWVVLALAIFALLLVAGGQTIVAAGIGFGAAVLHVAVAAASLRERVRRRLGPSFALIGLGWVMLPASLLLAGALASGILSARFAPVFGLVLVGGWLLSNVLGVLMRILPFLATLHAARQGRRLARIAELGDERLLWVQAAAHAAALLLVTIGAALEMPALVRLGACVGVVGAGAFLLFAALLAWRLHELPPREGASTGLVEHKA